MSIARWLPPLAVAALAIVVIAGTLAWERSAQPAAAQQRVSSVDWSDDGAFVVDANGAPVASALVYAHPLGSLRAVPETLRTDARGHFDLAVPALYRLWIATDDPFAVRAPQLFAQVLDVAPPLHGLRIVAREPDVFRFTLRFPDGAPAASLGVDVDPVHVYSRLGALTTFEPVWSETESTDPHGRLVLRGARGALARLQHTEFDPRDDRGCVQRVFVTQLGAVTLGQALTDLVVPRPK